MRIGGLASGMDTDMLIKQMMDAQRIPLNKLAQKKQLLEWKRDDYRTLNNKILEFRNASFDMKLQAGYLAKKVSSSSDNIVSVSGGASVAEGQYTIKVKELAKSANYTTGELGTTGNTVKDKLGIEGMDNKLTISGGTGSGSATITVNENESMENLINSINEKSPVTGVKAVYDTHINRIFFMSTKTGANAEVNLSLTYAADVPADKKTNNLFPDDSNTVKKLGEDAKVEFNGVEANYASNTFTIGGLTFTAKQKSDEVVNIGVAQDIDSVVDTIKKFVDKYNSLIDEVNKEVKEKRNRDFQPLSDEERKEMSEDEIKRWEEKARSGMLANDAMLSSGLSSFRRALSDTVSGLPAGQFKNLAEIGISNTNIVGKVVTGDYSDRGKLYIDEEKLKKALTDNAEQVMALFTKDGATEAEDGIATRLYDKASALFTRITEKAGTTSSVESNYLMGKESKTLNDQMARLTLRLTDLETRYYKQFTAMETYLNKMNSQSAWLAQQFSS